MATRWCVCICAGLLCLAATHVPALAQLELNSGLIQPGGTYAHTFNASGAYPYHCAIHVGMNGAVTVVAGAPQSVSVTIVSNAFSPSSVSVAPGGTVTWTNVASTAHTVTSDNVTATKRQGWGAVKSRYRGIAAMAGKTAG
jgi:plastocyanin